MTKLSKGPSTLVQLDTARRTIRLVAGFDDKSPYAVMHRREGQRWYRRGHATLPGALRDFASLLGQLGTQGAS